MRAEKQPGTNGFPDTYLFPNYIFNGEMLMYEDGWFLNGWITLNRAAELCKIPTEDVLILKMTYGF